MNSKSVPHLTAHASVLHLAARARREVTAGSGIFRAVRRTLRWELAHTAVIVCDMWDHHWCAAASCRVDLLAPAMNRVITAARERGMLIIHAPSETMDAYADTPQRIRAVKCVSSPAPEGFERGIRLDPHREAALPIDDSDGGCDDALPCRSYKAWTREHPAIEIADEDFVSDRSHEIVAIFKGRDIRNVFMMGVHTNMCILARPFAIRRLVGMGYNVVLVRDMTDAMYNPRLRPFVTHSRGTRLVIEHIESYWCPSVTSTSITGQAAFRFLDR